MNSLTYGNKQNKAIVFIHGMAFTVRLLLWRGFNPSLFEIIY